jgi:hypothetical protein
MVSSTFSLAVITFIDLCTLGWVDVRTRAKVRWICVVFHKNGSNFRNHGNLQLYIASYFLVCLLIKRLLIYGALLKKPRVTGAYNARVMENSVIRIDPSA